MLVLFAIGTVILVSMVLVGISYDQKIKREELHDRLLTIPVRKES